MTMKKKKTRNIDYEKILGRAKRLSSNPLGRPSARTLGDGPVKMQSIFAGRGSPLSPGENRQETRGYRL
jgi:hypothetical protein